jgi:tetratricopeptide (TPR) repeat protein
MESLPPGTRGGRPAPAAARDDFSLGGFGEIELPHPPSRSLSPSDLAGGAPPLGQSAPSPRRAPGGGLPIDSADFGDLELGEHPRTSRPPSVHPAASPRIEALRDGGGMGFGEVDLGSVGNADTAGISLEATPAGSGLEAPLGPGFHTAAATVPLRPATSREPPPVKRSPLRWVAAVILVLVLLGGGALQLTPYGAYGYLFVGDVIHAADYERATSAAIAACEASLAADTYDGATAAVDAAYAAHAKTRRATSLTAYAAFVDYEVGLRFGADPARVSRAKQALGELLPNKPVKYQDAALAAQAGESDPAKAAVAVDAVAKRGPAGPLALDLALLEGGLQLSAGDLSAALASFKRAVDLSSDANAPAHGTPDVRAHFGLARVYDGLGDWPNAKKEIEATLAASPQHPGALTLRARPKSAAVDPAKALRDLALVIDGPARPKAAPAELAAAYAAKAWIELEHGAAADARDAFDQAVKLDPRNAGALSGEGRLLMNEGRFAEALARFDTALQSDPNSAETIANDAEAKIGLERLADAKQQLVAARERFPKSLPVLLLLARVEQHLGNNDAAEAVLKTALACVDPSRPDALLAYVAMSELLSARGRLSEAREMLEEARKKLPPSSTLERSFGDISEVQGDYDAAIGHYKAAILKDPKDVTAHFKLGVALRRMRKFEEAGTELDRVAAVDKDYPGLALERGILYEESGDVQKAIDLFKGALAKAPDDADLQLRVGSAYVAIGRPDDALTMLRKVLEQRPTSAEAHHYMGRALLLKGASMQADALRYLKRAVELDPNRAEFHVYVAWAADDATPAQLELARDEVDKALALDKVNAEAYWQRGIIERMEGAIEDAVKDEKHALELRPSRYEAHATLAECSEDKNDNATAMAEWAKAIAGDGPTPQADGTVPHPYWRYRYGKLLMDKGGPGAALPMLLPAVSSSEKMDPRPGWLGPLEFLSAEALRKAGRRNDAIEHYQRFLEIAPLNSPDRADAQKALGQLTGGAR